jgi:hypothetical protein
MLLNLHLYEKIGYGKIISDPNKKNYTKSGTDEPKNVPDTTGLGLKNRTTGLRPERPKFS